MGIINHFSQGNNDQEYEGLHSHWRDKEKPGVEKLIEANQEASDLHRKASNKAHYNLAIDHAISIIQGYEIDINKVFYDHIINQLTNLKKD